MKNIELRLEHHFSDRAWKRKKKHTHKKSNMTATTKQSKNQKNKQKYKDVALLMGPISATLSRAQFPNSGWYSSLLQSMKPGSLIDFEQKCCLVRVKLAIHKVIQKRFGCNNTEDEYKLSIADVSIILIPKQQTKLTLQENCKHGFALYKWNRFIVLWSTFNSLRSRPLISTYQIIAEQLALEPILGQVDRILCKLNINWLPSCRRRTQLELPVMLWSAFNSLGSVVRNLYIYSPRIVLSWAAGLIANKAMLIEGFVICAVYYNFVWDQHSLRYGKNA